MHFTVNQRIFYVKNAMSMGFFIQSTENGCMKISSIV
jgi:hypothetical protein